MFAHEWEFLFFLGGCQDLETESTYRYHSVSCHRMERYYTAGCIGSPRPGMEQLVISDSRSNSAGVGDRKYLICGPHVLKKDTRDMMMTF